MTSRFSKRGNFAICAKITTFVVVKNFLLILTFLLSILSGAKSEVCEATVGPASETPQQIGGQSFNRDICLSSSTVATFSGENTVNSISIRNTQTGRRAPQNLRSSIRDIKAGKSIDYNQFYRQQSVLALRSSHSVSGRYLYTLCNLLI